MEVRNKMEDDLNQLKKDLEEFCMKYNVTIRVETLCNGRLPSGKIIDPKVSIKMEKY